MSKLVVQLGQDWETFFFFLIYFLLPKDQVGSTAGNPWEAIFFF